MDKKYKNINDSFDYKGIVFLEPYEELISILDLDIEKYQFFLQFKSEYRNTYFQCIKSEENNNTDKISEFNAKEHVREGNYYIEGVEYYQEKFDETNEVNWGRSNIMSLAQINSIDLTKKLFDKIKECQNELEESVSFAEFYDWIELEESNYNQGELDERFSDFIEKLNGNNENFEVAYDEIKIDEDENLIHWFSYDEFDEEYLQLGYKKITN